MMRKVLLLALLGVILSTIAVQAKTPINLKSEQVNLPQDDRKLPDAPGAAVASDNCLICHSAGMILNQPTMAKAAWEGEVNKMRNVYKAPMDEKDVPAIVDYLTAIKSPK